MTSSLLRLAIDIGGTFTDTVLLSGTDRVLATAKSLTTHANPALGAREGCRAVLASAGREIGDVTGMIHGTTLATNALIEKRGAPVATITTAGFRDILEIAYERRYSQYDLNIDKPDLLVPRNRAFTIGGRILASGREHLPLDESVVPALADQIAATGAEAVAICLMHSYANPAHELALAERLSTALPSLDLSLSHQISPEAREFDRLSTTIANAYIRPLIAGYLAEFERLFAEEGLACPILMMTAGGGMTTLETAARVPIRLLESGPAGGAVLAARVARQCGAAEVLSFDMGGTTAKLCLIDQFEPQTTRQFEIARAERFLKGSGMPVRIPVVEMIEIGAGGGSIATVDRLGRLMVGPQSAGSEPGPAAFGRGGTAPTVTDADLTQGLLDAEAFAEGKITLSAAAAHSAIAAQLAAPLALSPEAAAQGVSSIVDENMASAARMHAAESGKTIGTRVMIAFGGNGPLHATRVARRAGVNHIIVPPDPSVGSALGFLFAPVSFEIVQSQYALLDRLDLSDVNRLLQQLYGAAKAVVRAGSQAPLVERRIAFMRYRGQGHEIEIPLPNRDLEAGDLPHLAQAFDRAYAAQFSRPVPGMTVEILNWAVRLSTEVTPPVEAAAARSTAVMEEASRRRILCDLTGERREVPVHRRRDLPAGSKLSGPALIAEAQTTTLVSADFTAFVDAALNLHLTRKEAEDER